MQDHAVYTQNESLGDSFTVNAVFTLETLQRVLYVANFNTTAKT